MDIFFVLFWCWITGKTIKTPGFYHNVDLPIAQKSIYDTLHKTLMDKQVVQIFGQIFDLLFLENQVQPVYLFCFVLVCW